MEGKLNDNIERPHNTYKAHDCQEKKGQLSDSK